MWTISAVGTSVSVHVWPSTSLRSLIRPGITSHTRPGAIRPLPHGQVRFPPAKRRRIALNQYMALDFDTCYRAVVARDARFDGRFFTAVASTGL